jgi:TPR repeat protein
MKIPKLHRVCKNNRHVVSRYHNLWAVFAITWMGVVLGGFISPCAHSAPVSGDYMMFQLADKFNDKKAQYIVGRKYYTGSGVSKDLEEAVKYLARSAQQGYDKAQHLLGTMNLYGDGVPTNYLAAYDLLNSAAEQGNTEARFELANLLFHDKYGRKDSQRAIALYEQAAEDRHLGAQYMAGVIYYEGRSTSADKTKGEKWLQLAANNGDKRASEYLTAIKQKATKHTTTASQSSSANSNTSQSTSGEAEKPVNKQFSVLLDNAKSGDVDAQYKAGIAFLNDENTEKNALLSVYWMRKAAEQDHAGAQHKLGTFYRDGIGVAKSESEAIKWFRLAASWGISSAQRDLESLLRKQLIQSENGFSNNQELSKPEHQYLLGMMYIDGNGVEKDPSTAVQWFLKAAQQNHSEAQYQLGQMYKTGLGVKANPSEAKTWLSKAADGGLEKASESLKTMVKAEDQRLLDNDINALTNSPVYAYLQEANNGDINSQYQLGMMYLTGKEVNKDSKKALRYLQLAAEDDHTQAQLQLADLYLVGLEVQKDYFAAAKWFKKAAEQGNAEAQYNLGNLYRKGQGVHKSNSEAVHWYTLAAKQGHLKARNRLGGCRIC